MRPAASPDGCAAAWPLRVTGKPARDRETSMADIKVFMIDDGTVARRAQDGEIVAAAQAILARSFRRNTALTSPRTPRR